MQGYATHYNWGLYVPTEVRTQLYWYVQEWATRVRACNYVKIETGWNFPPVLKIVTPTAQAMQNVSVHVTSVLFLVRFNNFALTMGFYWSYTLLL